jgi:hypothetical protein
MTSSMIRLRSRALSAACKKAGIEPDFITYADGDSDGYALAVNINRRHLKPGARHLITEMARRRKEGVAVPLRQVAKANGTMRVEARMIPVAIGLGAQCPALAWSRSAGAFPFRAAPVWPLWTTQKRISEPERRRLFRVIQGGRA